MDIFFDKEGNIAFSFLNYKDNDGVWHWVTHKDGITLRGKSENEYQSMVDAMASIGIDDYVITRRENV